MKQNEFQVAVIVMLGLICYELMAGIIFIILAIIDMNRWLKVLLAFILTVYFIVKINKLKYYYKKFKTQSK